MAAKVRYFRHQLIELEEDLEHELKAHRCLSFRDLSNTSLSLTRNGVLHLKKLPKGRHPISKLICGMINTGLGGKVYIGVTDTGLVEGLMLSPYQKDHFLLSLKDLFASFRPPVPDHFWSVNYIPVCDSDGHTIHRSHLDLKCNELPIDPLLRNLTHELRESRYCWCDSQTLASMEAGIMMTFSVIELTLFPWKGDDRRNANLRIEECPDIIPIFENELGISSLRMHGWTKSISKLSVEETIGCKLNMKQKGHPNDCGEYNCGYRTRDSGTESICYSHPCSGFASADYDQDCHISALITIEAT